MVKKIDRKEFVKQSTAASLGVLLSSGFIHKTEKNKGFQSYDIMQEVFEDYGECYRIGGDEFACIYLNPNPSIYEEKLVILEGLVKAVNKTTPYEFGISVGSAIHREVTVDQTELFNLADTMMYQYRKIKQQQ